jgi:hypothetical protein
LICAEKTPSIVCSYDQSARAIAALGFQIWRVHRSPPEAFARV